LTIRKKHNTSHVKIFADDPEDDSDDQEVPELVVVDSIDDKQGS
jgi:hypothetical protein